MATLTTPALKRRTGDPSRLAHVDLVLLALPIAISLLGLLMIYDSSRAATERAGVSRLYFVERQGLAVTLGLVAMFVVPVIKGAPIPELWPRALVSVTVNAAWGLGTAFFLRLFGTTRT